jgi:DNA-nicking Smr family endonuclease
MKKENAPVTADDAELLRQALQGAVPLPPTGRVPPAPLRRKPLPRAAAHPAPVADTLSDHGAGDIALTEFLRPGLSRMALKKLRRGQLPVEDSLDLHGLKSIDARGLLLEFLREARQRGLRCICVVHGKGWQAGGGEGILKIRTRHWLTQCTEVLAFVEAPLNRGGGGAVLVLLRAG